MSLTFNQKSFFSTFLPSVNRGSGSFLKKDFSKLLMTLRSCHLCKNSEAESQKQFHLWKHFEDSTQNWGFSDMWGTASTPLQWCWCPGPCWDAPGGWTPWHCYQVHDRFQCTPDPWFPQLHSTSPQWEEQTVGRRETPLRVCVTKQVLRRIRVM